MLSNVPAVKQTHVELAFKKQLVPLGMRPTCEWATGQRGRSMGAPLTVAQGAEPRGSAMPRTTTSCKRAGVHWEQNPDVRIPPGAGPDLRQPIAVASGCLGARHPDAAGRARQRPAHRCASVSSSAWYPRRRSVQALGSGPPRAQVSASPRKRVPRCTARWGLTACCWEIVGK